jgi:hypothetical protein
MGVAWWYLRLLSSFIHNELVAPAELLAGIVLAICPTFDVALPAIGPERWSRMYNSCQTLADVFFWVFT